MSVRMEFDWVEASPSTDALAQTTMAALTIEVDGRVVTSVLDHRSRSCRKHVVTPLVTVAEWLVGNWWRLFHEIEDERAPREGFAEAHDLAFAGDGFLLPKLTIAPTPRKMQLRWARHRPAYGEIEFTEQGAAYVDRQDLEDAIRDVVDATRDRLASAGLESEFLQRDWAAIQEADGEEREFCRAAALAGEDPFAVPNQLAMQIIEFWQRTEPAIREDVLATASGIGLASLADWLADALTRVGAVRDGANWAVVREALPARAAQGPYRRPHERGYHLARAARAELTPGTDRYDFAATGADAVPSIELPLPTRGFQGLVAADSPACAMEAHGNGRRFLQGRALGDYLGRTQAVPAVLSGLATERQAQSRAFAAEFLAPSDWLRRRTRGGPVYPDEVDELANEAGVSSYVIRHQIRNHGLATLMAW